MNSVEQELKPFSVTKPPENLGQKAETVNQVTSTAIIAAKGNFKEYSLPPIMSSKCAEKY